MLMGHPPPIVARGRENRPRGGFEGPMPRQVPMVMEELVACDAQVQEALADPLEVVQEITQAGPQAFHCVTVHTRAVRITTSILARAMVDRPMVIIDLSNQWWHWFRFVLLSLRSTFMPLFESRRVHGARSHDPESLKPLP